MTSYLTEDFIREFRDLPDTVKKQARKAYRLWKANPNHPSLQFKPVSRSGKTFSVRISGSWRVLGFKQNNSIYWYWIGSHAEYDKILSDL
jgi:hypothetical protein